MSTTYLGLKWTTSRARDTYGYNIVTLTDGRTGKKYRAMGGGYDMVGTVLGHWLADVAQDALRALADEHGPSAEHRGQIEDFYGMYRWEPDGPVTLDGACGLSSMEHIAKTVGVDLERTYVTSGLSRGGTTGWFATLPEATK